ncbi:MAG: N-methyl-L-tryptophan oxidase [Candidatus Melainabacteria bacterium]|nr:MAG: N-methyl-L-tryptophan oxidase [Candidatus Melainabacteria bacterium]
MRYNLRVSYRDTVVPQSYNTIVLGLGAMGSATTYQLAKRGDKVLGIDRHNPPHTLGSSHGGSRITRQAIGEGVEYTPLALRSYEIVQELESLTGNQLLLSCGGLMISNKNTKGVHHVQNFFETTVAAAKIHNIKYETLEPADIRKRFPVFKVSDSEYAYYEPAAGVLFPETCIKTQLDVARSNGAAIHTGETVLNFEETKNGVKVKTDQAEYTANQLIITAGPWLPELLKEHPALAGHFSIARQVMYWFDIKSHYDSFKPGTFPIFIWEGHDDLASSYGMPALDGPDGGFKTASPQFNEIVTPDTVNREITQAEIDAIYNQQVQRCFDGVSNKCLRSAVCMYTDTSDSRFVIDKLPGSKAIIVASPCSGHGFKHSPAVGECLAELALFGKSKLDISGFEMAAVKN